MNTQVAGDAEVVFAALRDALMRVAGDRQAVMRSDTPGRIVSNLR
jgi:hypothetical protein